MLNKYNWFKSSFVAISCHFDSRPAECKSNSCKISGKQRPKDAPGKWLLYCQKLNGFQQDIFGWRGNLCTAGPGVILRKDNLRHSHSLPRQLYIIFSSHNIALAQRSAVKPMKWKAAALPTEILCGHGTSLQSLHPLHG